MNDRLETIAAELEASGDYKVQRRLQSRRSLSLHHDGSPTRRGLMLDVETTGLDPATDEIIELAMLPFTFTEDGHVVDVLPAFDRLREPSKPIPAEITALTGIDDKMVKGHTIDLADITETIAPVDLVIAHNAKFDRRFAERFNAGFVDKAWACSMTQAQWEASGVEGTKLGYLLNAAGLFHDGHRALDDCRAAVELLARPLGETGRTALSFVLEAAARTTFRIWATGAPYETKDRLRSRFYRWNPGTDGRPRAWSVDVGEDQREAEVAFLREEVFGRDWMPTVTPITAFERFSDRA